MTDENQDVKVIDTYGQYTFSISADGKRYHIYQNKVDSGIVIDRSNFAELKEALVAFKKIISDDEKDLRNAKIEAAEAKALDLKDEIESGQERLDME